MTNWRTTILAIRLAIWPQKNNTSASPHHPGASSNSPYILNDLAGALDVNGVLNARVAGGSALAAPFILFRLKREGFSACQVIHEQGGLTIIARR